MCGTMTALLYHWLRYALILYPSVLSGYINLLPLAIHSLPNFSGCPLYCLSMADDRTKQINEHVKHAHNDRNSQRSHNRNATHVHQPNCERRCDYHHQESLGRCSGLVRVRRRATTRTLHPSSDRSPFVGGQKNGSEMRATIDYAMTFTHYRPDSCPSCLGCLFAYLYSFLPTDELYLPSCRRVARERTTTLQPPPRVILFRAHSQRRLG